MNDLKASTEAGVPAGISRQEQTELVPTLPARDCMSDEEFDAMMEEGYRQAMSGDGLPLEEAFADINQVI